MANTNKLYATAAPVSGAWGTNDIVLNTFPTQSNPNYGWICTSGGTPGTWVTLESLGPTPLSSADHFIPVGSAPAVTAASLNASFGTCTAVGCVGTDTSFIVTFTAGTYSGTPIATGATLFEITFNQAWSSTGYVVMGSPASTTAGGNICGVVADSQHFVAKQIGTFTPSTGVTYNYQFLCVGAGATY